MPDAGGRPMSAFVRGSDRLKSLLLALFTGLAAPAVAQDSPPARVVSMNLCTDQLALMVAAPGQLVSVSYLAVEQAVPPLAEAARALHGNRGLAEEIYRLRPDLILTGPYTAMTTVAMLERLGLQVERFPLLPSFDAIVEDLRRMGRLLHREERAAELIAQFTRDRETLAARIAGQPQLRAAVYSAQGWTAGAQTLEGEILAAAGLVNIAGELGLGWGGFLPLEALLLADPDRLILGRADGGGGGREGHSQARALLAHPALRGSRAFRAGAASNDSGWICGTPYVLEAAARLIEELGR
ncbi:ABC transporter substrate-binding protein [Pararhodobacter oceanensis]|uniref:ABC transporter substrate-binding protein n=2 Tax=Pararhodobacter oceanensis TaxID=2172121 RepID=A0A2T8HXM1_9RHOB|nr:ABC transporter substrate-binding protein [Pararhodobacter oceanensis]